MTSVLHRYLALSLILLTGCSSSGIFNARSSRGKDGVAQAFESQREAAREERPSPSLRRADAPVARSPASAANPPADSRQKLQIAEALAQAGRAERANDPGAVRAAYERILTLEPTHAYANYQLAVIADNEGRFTEAERHYQTLLSKSPRNADLLASLGWSYLLQGRYEESERTLREALAADSKHRTAMYNLGWLYGTLGDYDQSLSIFRAAGTEEDAQRAIAELFPRGRPAASAQLASGLPRNPFVSEPGGSSSGRSRNDNQYAAGPLSAPAPWQKGAGNASAGNARVQTASTQRGKPAHDGFDAEFAQLEGANSPGNGPPRIGGVIQAGGSDLPLAPPPEHDMPVITPRAGSAGGGPADGRIAISGESHASGPLVGELTATRSRNSRGNPQALPDWPDRDSGPRSAGDLTTGRAQAVAARLGLSAGPGGLLFPLSSAPAPVPAALSRNSQEPTGANDRAWADQRTADRLPRW